MADYDDPDPALFRSGNVVWAKVYDRPWWPCVMFNSWAAVRRWNLPVPMEGVAELGEDQARRPAFRDPRRARARNVQR